MDVRLVALGFVLITSTQIYSILSVATGKYYLDHHSGRCMRVFDDTLSWESAVRFCADQGAELGKITSQNDQNFYTALLQDDERSFWSQMNDRDKENTFVYLDGSLVNYTNWMSNQPDGHVVEGDCVRILRFKSWSRQMWLDSAEWDDHQCKKEFPFVCEIPENPTCLPLPGYGQETAVDSSSWSTLISKMTPPSTTSGTTNLTTTTSATAASSDTYIASTEAFKPTLDNDTTTTGSATEATTETTTETPVPQVHGTGSGITNASTTDMDWAVTTMTPNSVTQLSVESTVTDVKAQTQLPATTEEPNVKVSAKEDEASHGRVREESDPIPRQYLTYIVAGSTFLGVPLMIATGIVCRYCCLVGGARRKVEDKKEEEEYPMKNFKM